MEELRIIEQYIWEKRGVRIKANQPRNENEYILMITMLQYAIEYFNTKAK